jgi:transposase
LAACASQQNKDMAAGLKVSRPTVNLWRKRVRDQGIGQVWEIAPGRGRKPRYDQARQDAIIKATMQTKPYGAEINLANPAEIN